ncbi:putative inorganic phosphate cotransporter [Drosophila albomicans]|uniref:Putative inorganic phosphate cotransporter n=1 Tax=Drosophila albomicans TaxID=7291 RepID=A0A6P8XZ79_DROAB|nr:putative inorganic phosphate cotransporter [Drosophila albomicans]
MDKAGGSKGDGNEKYALDSQIPAYVRSRFFVTIMLFLGMANAYVMRTNMSVAIVAMVNHTAIKGETTDNETDTSDRQDGEFNWSYKLQGYILACFFYGYVITQIPFGFLINTYGAKHFLGWGMMINSIAAFFVPIAARKGGYIALCAVRFIQGLGEGPIVPCTHAMLAQWIPPGERSRSGAAVYAGAQFGTIISMPLSGLLATYGFDGGWPSIFYVFGAASTIWCVLFILFVAESPSAAKNITEAERKHIVETIWSSHKDTEDATGIGKTPLRSIFTSLPFWGILIAHCGHNYGYETLMTELPTYMAMVMNVKLKENGFLSSLPYLAMWLNAMLLAFIADFMISKNVSITITRKVMNSIGQYVPAVALFLVGYLHESLMLTVLIFTIGMACNGAIYSGFKINHLDLSPRFAGLLIAITNCSANLVGLTAPMIAGHVINHDPSISNWRIVFLIASIVYFIVGTIYNLLASGVRQW